MNRVRMSVTLVALLMCGPIAARADVVLDWNAIAVSTVVSQGQSPFAQPRFLAITQLAVFEAVNAITGDYEPYLGTVVAPAGASADAAAVAAAYHVLKNYFPLAPNLDLAYAASLAVIPNGSAKSGGIATGQAAAAQMIASRLNDGSSPPQFYVPASTDPGVWQLTPGCPAAGGVGFQWQNMTPFGVPSVPGSQAWIAQFDQGPPPTLTSTKYARDYNEVKRVGNVTSDLTERPLDRADVARFYAASSPSFVFNLAARQVAAAEGASLSKNARALALLNMATNDSLVASFWMKYHYALWRPETAIFEGAQDGNARTDGDTTFVPYIPTPCFPSYPSNHGSGSNSAAEILRRVYGAGGHAITMANSAVPGPVFHYTRFDQITTDISDARVYGGIHFRFDQDAGDALGRDVGTYVYRHNLRRAKHSDHDDDGENDADDDTHDSEKHDRHDK
ncbi:MAG: vanadium-dependent haloperoxidase [Acidobacteria bacterium]|nr:vanadium-dependent haloperoxidase [Acidobacteriota bacterium]